MPFTYRAKPNVIIKELYVAEGHRSKRIGELLMKEVAREAKRADCGMIKWWVAKWNERGIKFYQRLGARIDDDLAGIPIIGAGVLGSWPISAIRPNGS